MAVLRDVRDCWIRPDSCHLQGSFAQIPASGCVPAFDGWPWYWTKTISALTAPEQSDVAAVRTFLQAKVDTLESCVEMRATNGFEFQLNTVGGVKQVIQVNQWWQGPTVAGKTRPGKRHIMMARESFTTQQQADLDAVVALLTTYLEAEEPLP